MNEWCSENPSVPTIARNVPARETHERHARVMRSARARAPTPDRWCLLLNLSPTEPWTFLLLTSSHVAIGGGGCLFRTAAVLTRAQIGRVPVPPVMRAVRLLVVTVMLFRLAEELCKSCDIHGLCSRRLPLASGQARRDLLQQPAVPVGILKRGKREVGTTFRVAPSDARVLHGVIKWAAGVVEDLAHVDPAADQVIAGGVDVIHCEDQIRRARSGRRDSLAEDDRRL